MKPITILKKARKLLDKPERWTQGRFAKDKFGKGVGAGARGAVCFCALGAIKRFDDGEGKVAASSFLRDVLPKGVGSIVEFNDAVGRKHSQILKLFDRAIEKARAAA